MRREDKCLAASVMLVNITLWEDRNITERVEELLESNLQKKLWHLGSMPPIMVVLHDKWATLGDRILDGKGSSCKNIKSFGEVRLDEERRSSGATRQ
jgi:hypothetical protein